MEKYKEKLKKSKFTTFFKYIADSDEIYKGLFKDRVIRFTQPAALNDPIEGYPLLKFNDDYAYDRFIYHGKQIPSYKEWVNLLILEQFYNKFGFLSLTKKPYNYDMWNLYASGHRGILVEFKENFDTYQGFKSESLSIKTKKVNYFHKPTLDYSYFEKEDEDLSIYEIIDSLFYQKTLHWKKEVEYRLLRPIQEAKNSSPTDITKSHRDYGIYLFDYDIDSIQSITFGALTPQKTKRKIIEWLKGSNIQFLQAILSRNPQINIYFQELSAWKSLDLFLSLEPQVFIIDEEEYIYGKGQDKTISNLDEIPFYESIRWNIDAYLKKDV